MEGKRALYLEYYETGFRKRENLHLYLLPDDAVGAAKAQIGLHTTRLWRYEQAHPHPSCIGERECQKRKNKATA